MLNLYLFTTCQLDSVLRLEVSAFQLNSEVIAVRDIKLRSRLWKNIQLSRNFSHFRSLSIRESACVNICLVQFR